MGISKVRDGKYYDWVNKVEILLRILEERDDGGGFL